MLGVTSLDTVIQVSKWILNTLFHQFVAVIFIYSIWIAIEKYSNPFSWHVILSTLGLMPFTVEALILFSNDNVWSQEISRKQKYWIHGILIFIGSFFIITGIALEIDNRVKLGVSHFTSAHSITGLIAMIFVIFALICGPMAFSTSIVTRWVSSQWLKLIHNILGQLTHILLLISLCLGFYTDWFSSNTSKSSRIAATIVTVLIMLWSLFCAWISLFKQIKTILR
ncbi:hypothetical protein ILUMI_13241 [Ignelater luminosus]|uniref:ascorbate ferrireductase (transmembrane) n=1 Tax=Ignelater luminosus TaxID=2038154 RepID=A0A8K0CYX4_IGNLU|nr:hypothetical protein ILUMI_13241 [Ignelater luminosus]